MSEDVRQNLPSASSMERFVSCPGSWSLEQGQPELPEEEVTSAGTRIHSAIEQECADELVEDEADIAKRILAMEKSAVNQWASEHGIESIPDRHAEQRLWIRDRITLKLVASAQLDVFYVHESMALIIDGKSGFKKATSASSNWQLVTQAICLKHEYPEVKTFFVAIAGARLGSYFDISQYSSDDLAHAEAELFHAIWKSKQPDQVRVPGQHCQYCRAKGVCPEAASYSLVTLSSLKISSPDKLAILGAVNSLTPAQLAHAWNRSKIANMIFDGVEAKLKAMTEPQLAELGLMLKPGAVQKKIVDNPVAQERLAPSLDLGEVISCSKISVTELANLYAAKHSVSKVSAKEAILELLGDAVAQTQNAPSLAVLK